jgi:hypothetical protein
MTTHGLESLMTLADTARRCEVFRCKRSKDLVHLMLANPRWKRTQDVWVCPPHKDPFTKQAEAAGCTVEVIA